MTVRIVEAKLNCDGCGAPYEAGYREKFDPKALRNGAEDAGWLVATRSIGRKDLCPSCRPVPTTKETP